MYFIRFSYNNFITQMSKTLMLKAFIFSKFYTINTCLFNGKNVINVKITMYSRP